ncbi:unnamed protein product [Caenorhabditis auriculariae]|uniref:Uncharacterized protein n=1 Tax=Caenorhabditis auriculariae TaxID=2777116 RepID=A0A8S1H956_9PELO|nr:unnamed protein product [Caenorhabditis auriculariae]
MNHSTDLSEKHPEMSSNRAQQLLKEMNDALNEADDIVQFEENIQSWLEVAMDRVHIGNELRRQIEVRRVKKELEMIIEKASNLVAKAEDAQAAFEQLMEENGDECAEDGEPARELDLDESKEEDDEQLGSAAPNDVDVDSP